MEKTVKNLFVNEIKKEVKITIYPIALLAIEKGWESLYFSNNSDAFGSVEIGNYIAFLDTQGEVRLINDENNLEFRNKDSKEIAKILDEGKLEDYVVDNNNWFAVYINEIKNKGKEPMEVTGIDDVVFEACPKTIEELINELKNYAVHLFQTYCLKKFQSTQSDLIKYNGMSCEIIGELNESDYDKKEVGLMYNIKLENGINLQAFSDELI